MPSITVRDVPDTLATNSRHTPPDLAGPQEYLRQELIDLASRPDPDVLARRIADRKRHTSATLSATKIIKHRDAGRR